MSSSACTVLGRLDNNFYPARTISAVRIRALSGHASTNAQTMLGLVISPGTCLLQCNPHHLIVKSVGMKSLMKDKSQMTRFPIKENSCYLEPTQSVSSSICYCQAYLRCSGQYNRLCNLIAKKREFIMP